MIRVLRIIAFVAATMAILTACPSPFGYYAAGNKYVKEVQTVETIPAQATASPTFSVIPVGGGSALTPIDGAVTGSSDLSIAIECATASSQIFFTRDGSTPDPYQSGTQIYSAPIAVKGNGAQLTIVAIALTPLMSPSTFSQLSVTISYRPIISSVAAGPSQATLAWQPVSGASSYNLYYTRGSSVTITTGAKVSGVSSPYTVSPLGFGTEYAFILTAVTAAGESAPSPVATATPAIPAPAGLAVGAATSSSMDVSWNAVSGAAGYELYRDTSATGSFTTLAYNGVSTAATVGGLSPATTYYFKARAFDSSGTTASWSSVVSGTTLDANGMPVLITPPSSGFTAPTQLPPGAPTPDYWIRAGYPSLGWVEGGFTYVVWPKDYQNSTAFAIACYDASGAVAGEWVYTSDRYITSATLYPSKGYIVLTGQSTTTNVIWSTIQQ